MITLDKDYEKEENSDPIKSSNFEGKLLSTWWGIPLSTH